MISISGGRWRGHKLKALDRKGLRPTSSRVKAAIFNIVESIIWKRQGQPDFCGWRCLDLFAGVGGLGIEILSRGATHCVFVEKNRSHARVLEENIRLLGCEAQSTVLVDDAGNGRWEKHGPYDLVLLDPPYANSYLPGLLANLAVGKVLVAGALVVFEHSPKLEPILVPGLTLHSTRVLGPAGISVYSRDA